MKNFLLLFIFTAFTNFITAQSISSFESFELPLDTFLNRSGETGQYTSGEAIFPNVFSPDFGGFWESGWAISSIRDDSTSGFGNLYGAITGSGFESITYAVGQQNAMIQLREDAAGKIVKGLYVTNTTFAHNSMRDGDDFAKKFGGETGDDPDFFKLVIQKYSNGQLAPQVVEFYLADFRFDDNSQDYIIADWQWVDLTSLGNVDSLQFTLSSSDLGDFGINTPLFFSIDNLEVSEEIATSYENIDLIPEVIKIYPNPTKSELFIDLPEIKLIGTLKILDVLGRLVIQQHVTAATNRVDVSRLEKGTYFLQLIDTEGTHFSSTFLKH